MWRSEQQPDPEVVKKLTPKEAKRLLSGKMPYGEFAAMLNLKKKG